MHRKCCYENYTARGGSQEKLSLAFAGAGPALSHEWVVRIMHAAVQTHGIVQLKSMVLIVHKLHLDAKRENRSKDSINQTGRFYPQVTQLRVSMIPDTPFPNKKQCVAYCSETGQLQGFITSHE